MQSELSRLSRLVNHSIDLSRLEIRSELELRPVMLLSLVELLIAQLTPQATAKGMTLSLQADDPLPLIYGDKDRLKQLFLNLIENAIKYSRPADWVRVALMASDEGIACSVSDNGPGIPAQHLPHITRRFYRVSGEQIAGSGLGLALAAEILHRHQSRLEIESCSEAALLDEGEETGTCMSFVLPRPAPSPPGPLSQF
jgi:two-component system phosphate regulon sensor histidine kinase PhoR